MNNTPESGFKALRCFNDPTLRPVAGTHGRIDARILSALPPEGRTYQILAALAEHSALPMKEVCESFEFFERIRKRIRAPHVADLCAGHGLTGILFALFERSVERVTLMDMEKPHSFGVLMEALTPLASWLPQKVFYQEARIQGATDMLEPGTSVVAIHACGARTDIAIQTALALRGAVAVMPCCYTNMGKGAPEGVREALGVALATDIDRTYRLHSAGYEVRWGSIPSVISPMNRVIFANLPTR